VVTLAGGLTELTEHALAGVEALDPELYFIDLLAADSALAAARRIDASPPGQRGALAGVPFLAKAGTSAASPVVGRLAAAGAVLLGTSTRPDPAAVCQARGWNGRDRTRSPWDIPWPPRVREARRNANDDDFPGWPMVTFDSGRAPLQSGMRQLALRPLETAVP